MQQILVIKLGALGDFILSWRAMTAIRAHHRDAHITLLTIASLKPLAEACGLFDALWLDSRPRRADPKGWWRLARRLRAGDFDRVYDLQTADRTGFYFRLTRWPLGNAPEWSGIVRGCSHRHDSPDRTTRHTLERQADQLAIAGIDRHAYPPLDLGWVPDDIARFDLDPVARPFVLMVPGGSAAHPEKRWPAESYAALARNLVDRGLTPVVLGMGTDAAACRHIAEACPEARNLCDDSPMLEVMALARHARAAVGNDTGPMHLIAVMGCPSLVLFSRASRPEMTRPRGPFEGPGARLPPPGRTAETVRVLKADPLSSLGVDAVALALPVEGFDHGPVPVVPGRDQG